jgi:magnesium transporter
MAAHTGAPRKPMTALDASERANGKEPSPDELPRSFFLTRDGQFRHGLALGELTRIISSGEGILWVDLCVDNRHHVAMLEKVCGFHPLSIEDTLNPNSRVKLEEYPGYLFMIIRGVRFYDETNDPYDLETFNLNFFLGPNYLVTVHGKQSAAIDDVAERVERNPELLNRGPARLMHAIADSAVDAYFPLLDRLDEFVDGLEQRVFVDFDRAALHEIFEVKRMVLQLRRHLAPQREVFSILTNRPSALLTPESQVYFRDVYDHVLRINDSLDTYRELLSSTLDSYLTQVSNRLGEITKGLSVVATVSLPFVVISGMWGMNVANIPLSQHPHAFWWMLGLQTAIGIALLLILRLRRLL